MKRFSSCKTGFHFKLKSVVTDTTVDDFFRCKPDGIDPLLKRSS